MPRKPAILLFVLLLLLLLLLLSIGGGAVFHHFHQEKRPGFAEVDTFLRGSAASGDWEFTETRPALSRIYHKRGWLSRLGISRTLHYQENLYLFTNRLTSKTVVASVVREDGEVTRVNFNGSSPVVFKEITYRGFPQLRGF